jgi:pimeloyl-ACP methyl ester carboxylesterase
VSPLTTTTVRTAKGASVRVLSGGSGPDLVFLHDVAGLLDDTSFLERLTASHHVVAPELPGYGDSSGEQLLEDMLDFTLHGWDVVDALGLARPTLVGHGMGGMIGAEMAALTPGAVDRLVLVAPLGLWLGESPIPDLFSMLPYEFPRVLFADPEAGADLLLARGATFADLDALQAFYVGNARRLGTAGKILFPVPNRQLARRLYRVTMPTRLVWGERDVFVDPAYAARWLELTPGAELEAVTVGGAGHMVPYERPDTLADAVLSFLGAQARLASR